MRQVCTIPHRWTLLTCVLLLGCVTEAWEQHWRIRLDIDDNAVKVTVLGTAAVADEEVPRDPLSRPRARASLAIRAKQDRVLHVVDPTESILGQLDQLERLDPLRPTAPLSSDPVGSRQLGTVLLTHGNAETLGGLKLLLGRLLPGDRLPVYAPQQVLRALADDSSLRLLRLLERMELREAPDGEPLRLGSSVLLTLIESPVDSGRAFLGLRIEGSRRALLYLPACGDLEIIRKTLVDQRYGPIQVALLDGTRFDHREPPQPGWPPGCHPPMTSVLGLLPDGFSARLLLRFTRLRSRSPVLDPDGRYLRQLVDRGAGLLQDGAEYWL